VTSGQKIAVSLLTTVLVFAAFAVAAFAGLFSVVEARFYQPVVINATDSRLNSIDKQQTEYIDSLVQRFSAYSNDAAVATYMQPKPADADVRTRTNTTGTLFSQTPALRGIRLIDSNGKYLHFSTFSQDVLKKTDSMISYKNYTDLGEISYDLIHSEDVRSGSDAKYKVVRDSAGGRIIYSFPYYDSYQAYRGTIAFYTDPSDFTRFLLSRNIITVSDTGVLVSPELQADTVPDQTGGIVFGLPLVGRDILEKTILEKWTQYKQNTQTQTSSKESAKNNIEKIASDDNGTWILFTHISFEHGNVAWIYKDDILVFPQTVRVLLLLVVFITLFLVVFLLFNLKHDDMVVIKDRIRRFQLAFITEYVNRQNDGDVRKLPENIAARRQIVNDEVRKSLGRRGKKHSADVDALLNRSWDEILTTLGAKPGTVLSSSPVSSIANTAELRQMLEEILASGTVKIQTLAAPAKQVTKAEKLRKVQEATVAEPVEEVEAAEPVEEVAEANSVEEVESAEPVEEVETAGPVEEVEAAEPVEDVEAIEPVEEAASAEPVEEIESAEPVEEVEAAESVDEVGEVEPVEEVEAAEPVEDVEAIEPVEEAASAEPVEEIESAEPVEEVEAAESVDEVGEVEPVEEVEAAEPVEDVEAIEPVEEAASAEPVEEIESAEPVEEVEAAESVDEVEAAESVEEVEGAEPVDEVGEVESVEETEAAEPVQKNTAYFHSENMQSVDISDFEKEDDESKTEQPELAVDGVIYDFSEPMTFGEPPRKQFFTKDDETSADNFSVESPNFSFLDNAADTFFEKAADADTVSDDEATIAARSGTKKDENVPFAEDAADGTVSIDLSEFGMPDFESADSKKDQQLDESVDLHESVGFSSQQPESVKAATLVNGADSVDSFMIPSDSLPDYSQLDDDSDFDSASKHLVNEEGVNLAPVEHAAVHTEQPELVEQLPSYEDSHPFLFTPFAANNDNITELTPESTDAIVQTSDGTYSVSDSIESNSVKQDSAFKKLVESVLK
jgi:hypothetical protein